jgi:rhodanese-related sulfurtransferase
LGELLEKSSSLDKSRPTIVVCRSGARSAQAAAKLEKAGFEKVANLAGGMLRWNAERLPIQ